jgi:cupin fold WbuC family metalloprotein
MPRKTPTLTDQLTESIPGVFYTTAPFVSASTETVAFLKAAAQGSPTRRARLCAHPTPSADQHDMLIVSHRDTYVAPHRHFAKSETLLVLEGTAIAVMFDDQGAPSRAIAMAPFGSPGRFFYRMPPGIFHGLLIRSEFLVFVESTKGPFRREDSENAPWAPAPNETTAGRTFCAGIDTLIVNGQLALES